LKFDELTIQKPPRGPRRLVDSVTEIGTPVKLGSIARLPILEHWALEGEKNAENATYLEYKGKFVWCCNHCQVKRTADISESTGNLWQHSNKHGFFSTHFG
jgi:hypothetical protein